MKRDVHGKFVLKNDSLRLVRSLRLTDTTWHKLDIISESLGITRSDFLEQMLKNEQFLPCNTWKNIKTQSSITRYEEEIERLNGEIQNLRQEKAALMERETFIFAHLAELDALGKRILFDLKLGTQAPGYKAAKKALNRFIAELTHLVSANLL